MTTSRLRPSPARERWVLAAGGAAALALFVAALKVLPDPAAAGSAEVARASTDVSALLQERWDVLRRRRNGLVSARPDLDLSETLEEKEFTPVSLPAHSTSEVFETLLAESARLEFGEEGLEEALTAVDEALAAATDPGDRARGLLRKIQLSAKAEDAERVTSAWRSAETDVSPQVELDGVSFLLQCAAAAAPLLSEGERALAQSPLAQAFAKGTLPLPGEPELDREGYPKETALVAFWIEQLEELSPDPGGRAAIERGCRRRERLALSGRPLPEADLAEEWSIDFAHEPLLAHWRDARGKTTLRYVDWPGTLALLQEEAALPEDFEIAFDGSELESTQIRERTLLAGSPVGFRIGHQAPEELRSGQARRVRYGRLGLLGLALTLVLASFFTARMLRRERRLAELKTRFIAGVSHDLRTPLASILLMAENLEDGRVQGEASQSRYYAAIRGEADRLRRLVDDVLDFSRLERGEGAKLKREDTDLEAFARELGGELSHRVERSGGTLTVEAQGLQHGFALDRDALRRSLWNLVDNAITHGGGGEIRFRVRGTSDALTFEVEDSGKGIPPSERERIFEAFRQGNVSGVEHAGGSGLGLAIVREIARAHGGHVVALDGSRGGALFRIHLPRTATESPKRNA